MKNFKKLFLNEHYILCLIVINAIIIFIQEFEATVSLLDYLEPIFTLLFVSEMAFKINDKGFRKYISNGWNRFDFILVIISIPSLAVIFTDNISFQLNIFLTLRALRIFKFFRLIRFLPNISSLMISVQRAIKASYLVIAGFFLLVFIFSVITCSIYKNIAPEYFSNPFNSFYSIFRLFSVEGWYEIPDLIAVRTSPMVAFFSKLYFVVLLLCGGILGLSLVNSIFVDAMLSDNNDELKEEVSELSKRIETLSKKIEELNENINK
jgi:voltage-gated sodium channel